VPPTGASIAIEPTVGAREPKGAAGATIAVGSETELVGEARADGVGTHRAVGPPLGGAGATTVVGKTIEPEAGERVALDTGRGGKSWLRSELWQVQ
jgi:hypothetical protein